MNPLLVAEGLSKFYGQRIGCRNVSFALEPGEVLAIVGESGSGKTTLLNLLSGQLAPDAGAVRYRMRDGATRNLLDLTEAERRFLARTDWGFVHQDARNGLRMGVSAGGNIGERLMGVGDRHYGRIRETAQGWLERVEIDTSRIDDKPTQFSGGMRQRLQIARNLVTHPRLVFMDEPTGGLDVSVQARLLDLIRGLVADLGLAVVLVTHDLSVARLLSHRILVMKDGHVIEAASRIACSTIRRRPTPSFSFRPFSPREDVMTLFCKSWPLQGVSPASPRRQASASGKAWISSSMRANAWCSAALRVPQVLDPQGDLRELPREFRRDHPR